MRPQRRGKKVRPCPSFVWTATSLTASSAGWKTPARSSTPPSTNSPSGPRPSPERPQAPARAGQARPRPARPPPRPRLPRRVRDRQAQPGPLPRLAGSIGRASASLTSSIPPLHSSVIVLDGRLSSVSRSQKAAIGRMRQALRDFTELNDAEKNAYLGRLQALDSKFTYRRPDELAGIIKKYNQASSLAERFATISKNI